MFVANKIVCSKHILGGLREGFSRTVFCVCSKYKSRLGGVKVVEFSIRLVACCTASISECQEIRKGVA